MHCQKAGLKMDILQSRRILLATIVFLGLLHIITVGQVPAVRMAECWRVDSSYAHFRFGVFDDTMFPGVTEFRNGSFGQGKLRCLLQSYAFALFGFGLVQARLPMLLGGLLAAYGVYLIGRLIFDDRSGLYAAGLYLLAPMFYEAHMVGAHPWLAAYFVLAAYFALRLFLEKRSVFAFAAGLTIGLSVSFHLTGILGVVPMTAILLYYRLKKVVRNAHVACYLLGGLVAFTVWSLFEIAPLGLGAFIEKSRLGVSVAQAEFIGRHWAKYFITGRRGTIIELPLFIVALGSVRSFWSDLKTRFIYLFLVGLIISYTLFSGSGSLITVWAVLFVLVGGLISRAVHASSSRWSLPRSVWAGPIALVLLYYIAVQAKRIHTAFWIKPLNHYTELTGRMADHIPEAKTIIGSPLYFLGFAGRNSYLAQNFYWELINKQTNELGNLSQQPASISAHKMLVFLKQRNVEYLIADEYFQEAIRPRIPEDQWDTTFTVVAKFQSQLYGASTRGGSPPYRIEIWRL